ncbi:unnamed protein product [Hermetia illucens]|uniref:Uncharacterized protein n=1 Tax=Hermetia illucens TaxID=343691 RepID=A0A7R8V1P5_HERIL|nr:glutathione hydrolase 1 proenzyme [Hermetia illucens]CAD7090854.1 unnamed protein product [Hermetia illucens]
MKTPARKKILIILLSCAGVMILVAIVLTLYFLLRSDSKELRGAVVSNGLGCAKIGQSIFKKGGSVVDVAIATLFCEGIADPQSLGIGGGFVSTIYIRSTGEVISLIAREAAPLAAHESMFVNQSVTGGLAVAVPGEIKGYSALHKKYGRLNWAELVEPTIKLCEEGQIVSPYLARILEIYEQTVLNSPSLKELFVNPSTGKIYKEGDKVKRTKLAETLRVIAKEGEDAIYNGGSIGKMLVDDIKAYGGIITEQDLKEYQVRWVPPPRTQINKFTVYSAPLPVSGSVLHLILNLIQNHMSSNSTILWHRTVEAFKHGYGLRTQLGDINFLPEITELVSQMSSQKFADELFSKIKDDRTFADYGYYGANFSGVNDEGTANVAVLGPNGDAISVTSTINSVFGAKIVSQKTGIILNDEMDDFSTPGITNEYGFAPSPANFIKPKKMPLSSMCPTIIVDDVKNPRLLLGAAGGSRITTSVAQVIIRNIILGEPIEQAVKAPRLHHQLSPMQLQPEADYNKDIVEALERIGHNISYYPGEFGFSALTAIGVDSENNVKAVYDPRRPGSAAYH